MMVRAIMAGTVLTGMVAVGVLAGSSAAPAWDCSLPENSGVAECPVLTTTSTAPATTSTVTQPVTTSTVPVTSTTVDATTSTVDATTSTVKAGIGTAVSTATPTSVVVGSTLRASRELPFTGGWTWPLVGLGALLLAVGAVALRAGPKNKVRS